MSRPFVVVAAFLGLAAGTSPAAFAREATPVASPGAGGGIIELAAMALASADLPEPGFTVTPVAATMVS